MNPPSSSDASAHTATATPPAPSAEVAASLAYCHRVTRHHARNFYYGLKLTPEPKRSALYAVYALMRACDDLADEVGDAQGGLSVNARLERIERFRGDMVRVIEGPADATLPEGPIWPAVRDVARTYRLDAAHLHLMLDGQREDLATRDIVRYDTFGALYDYCYKVASVVGLVCLDVWGHDSAAEVHDLAEKRGIAFQLTNILRDLKEDAQRGRVYLPREDMTRFGVSADDFLNDTGNAAFNELMAYQIERARDYYEASAALESHLDPHCRATSWAMNRIYRRLLERIAAHPRRVLDRRVRLSSFEKLGIAARATWRKRRE